MKICIIGSGHIGAGLARAWSKHGHQLVFGARDPGVPDLGALCAELGASAKTIGESANDAEVVVLAVPYGALDTVLGALGALSGKVVIDCTNAVEKGMTLKYGHTTSAAEELQKRLPHAHVFKSFNAQGAENLAAPDYPSGRATNFFCGDDLDARRVVQQLVQDVGFDAVDAGPLKNARLLEPMMLLWVACAQRLGTRDIAFRLLRR
jgi:hypothetical protein